MKTKLFFMVPCLVALLISTLFTSSCHQAPKMQKFTEYSLDYFDTVTTIVGYEETEEAFAAVSREILSMLSDYHRLYTIYYRFDGLENLCTVNSLENGVHPTVTADRRIIDMLLYAKDMYALTDGRVNIAMGSVLSVWHDYRTRGLDDPASAALPPQDMLLKAAEHTDIDALIIDEEASTVWISDPAMTLDVGAIAKGYAVEMAAQMLEARGITGYVINVGGNVRTVGPKGDGAPWVAGIENPDDNAESPYLAYLALSGETIVTSGSYQRFYIVNGQNYHHIIDAQTLMPAIGYTSVSVVCGNSALADALSTALFCMPQEEGLALIESLDGTEAFWVADDGTQTSSSGFSAYLTEP